MTGSEDAVAAGMTARLRALRDDNISPGADLPEATERLGSRFRTDRATRLVRTVEAVQTAVGAAAQPPFTVQSILVRCRPQVVGGTNDWRWKLMATLSRSALPGFVAGLFLAATALTAGQAPGGTTPSDVFLLKGVVANAKGPLADKVVIVSPIDARTGAAPTRYSIVGGRPGPMINPKTTTDAKGAFSVSVPRSLFEETPGCAVGCTQYKTGELSLGVYDDMGGGSMRSYFKPATVKYDEKAAIVDAGRLVLEPLK